MRGILVDWMVEIHNKWDKNPEVLHLSIQMIDRYLSEVQMKSRRLQLIGITAMYIASKFLDIKKLTIP